MALAGQGDEQLKRARAIINRWITLISYGVLAAIVWVLIASPIRSLLALISNHFADLRSDLLASALLVLTIAACWPLGRRRWKAFFGIRHLGTYPPLWIAIVTALLVIALYADNSQSWDSASENAWSIWWLAGEIPLWVWVALGVAGSINLAINNWPTKSTREAISDLSDFVGMRDWLHDDQEITHPDHDRFGHDEVAVRVVKRLTETEDESPTMAIVGPLGSGKSTIRGLVEHRLKAHRHVEMCNLSLWSFDSAEAAVAGILRAVIQALGKHVNTLALTGLSERYVTVIERVGGRWGILARLLRGQSRPEVILQELSAIATAAGVKLVLWIEDMERFTGVDRLPPEEAAIREAERLGPILSLLVLLDRCDSISVIVGDTSLRSRLDVEKIARFVEHSPRLTQETVWHQIAMMRSECLGMDFKDPASNMYRDMLAPSAHTHDGIVWFASAFHPDPNVPESVGMLLNTPRSLKHALRITWETWGRLRGEIDFDSVLVASVIRVARPDIFAFIDEYSNLIRSGVRSQRPGRQNEEEGDPVTTQLKAILDRESDERIRKAVKRLIEYIYPATFKGSNESHYVGCPQGLSVNRHTDYWQRYMALPEVDNDASDQAALRDIESWKNESDNTLVSRVVDPVRAAQIETFVGQFSPADLCRLLAETAEALRNESASTWEDGRRVPGITSVWRMMLRRTPGSDVLAIELMPLADFPGQRNWGYDGALLYAPDACYGHPDALKRLIREITPHHLPLIHDIHYLFATADGNVPRLLDDPTRRDVNALLIETFRSAFSPGSGKRLLRAVHDGSPYIVYWICWGLARIRANRTQGEPFDEWSDVAEVLLEAAEHDRGYGVPLIVPFVTKSDQAIDYRASDESGMPRPTRNFVAEFDEDAARNLFDYDRLIHLLSKTERPSHLSGKMAVQFDAAHEAALLITNGE